MPMSEFAIKMRNRTKGFALNVLQMTETLKRTSEAEILKKQLIRSATSIGANYRSACRARSKPEFISKMKIVVEEADETQYWLELLNDLGFLGREQYNDLSDEAGQIVAIFVKAVQTSQSK